jgi:transposase InsO family protein
LNIFDTVSNNARHRRRAVTADFLFAEDPVPNDGEDLSEDPDGEDLSEDPDTDLAPIANANEFNPEQQPLHPEEETLRAKLAINVPAFTAGDLYQIRICSKVRKYLEDGTVEGNHKFRNAVKKLATVCFIHEDKLYRKRRAILREVCDNYNSRRDALRAAHDGALHRGVENTMVYLTSRFWFPQMEKFVCRYIAQCGQCQRYARAGPISQFPNYAFQISDILAHWNVDFAGPFLEDLFGFRYACIGVEAITRWAEIRPSVTNTAADAANFLYHDIVCRFGLPKSIQSDNGPHFANECIQRLTETLQIRHKFSTPYYPQSNGRAERLIGTLKTMLAKAIQESDRDTQGKLNWQPAMYSALYVYRVTPHYATGVSPAYLLYGENVALPFQHNHQQPDAPRDQVTHKKLINERLDYIRDAIPGLRGSHHKFARTKEGRKILVRPTRYSVDDRVLMANPKADYTGYGSAFGSPWIGPYRVYARADKGNYRLATIPKEPGTNPSLLRYPINWSRLRKFTEEGDDEFFVKDTENADENAEAE